MRNSKKKSNKFSLSELDPITIKNEKLLKKHDPRKSFQNPTLVGKALLESLEANDPEAFIEILDAYLQVNKMQVAHDAELSRSTVQGALSKTGNPTIRTLAKIVHHSM